MAKADDPHPFRCPNAGRGDDVDHVLRRSLSPELRGDPGAWRAIFLDPEPTPFVRYRRLSHAYQTAMAHGLCDGDYVGMVRELDAAVAGVDGRGFQETPYARSDGLSGALGFTAPGGVLVKDETANVSGSHKARHLFGVMVWLGLMERLGFAAERRPLAIASCGNAALAAAVVAKAVGRELHVFVPPDADPAVLARLTDLGAVIAPCPRDDGRPGDPCVHRFREEIARGALPFTCQGNENGLVVEGGMTLGWEIVSATLRGEPVPDRLVVQVGGGALASACVQAFAEARRLGLLTRLPRVHAVQTGGAWPLPRAWDRLLDLALRGAPGKNGNGAPPRSVPERTERMHATLNPARMKELLHYASQHRSAFMWPWETPPSSIATGILDDETYDWLAVVRGMLHSGGFPVIATEADLAEAHHLMRDAAGIRASVTGAAGLAGLLALRRDGLVRDDERVAVLATGGER